MALQLQEAEISSWIQPRAARKGPAQHAPDPERRLSFLPLTLLDSHIMFLFNLTTHNCWP